MSRGANLEVEVVERVEALGKSLSLAFELGAMRTILDRLLETGAEGYDRPLVQSVCAVVSAIVRIVQLESRLLNPNAEYDAALAAALAELEEDTVGTRDA